MSSCSIFYNYLFSFFLVSRKEGFKRHFPHRVWENFVLVGGVGGGVSVGLVWALCGGWMVMVMGEDREGGSPCVLK